MSLRKTVISEKCDNNKEKRKKVGKKKTPLKSKNRNNNPIWGGRFSSKPNSTMEEINCSIHFDWRLYKQDIACSKAHAAMLAAVKIISDLDAEKIIDGLDTIEQEIEAGIFEFDSSLEDIHMNVENRLNTLIGETAGRLHTARSRNDQVATDFKLWVRDAIDQSDQKLQQLQHALIERAEEHVSTILPGFTHLQNAQPITLGHHFLSYVEMFGRDRGRFADTRKRLNECPLGAAALAGTSFPIDRQMTSKTLEFDRPTHNSLDSVSARDFALEFMATAALCSSHLSRLGEEIVIWSTSQFGFIKLSDNFSTGSSIMPQKRNPDAAELIRGKSGRISGSLLSLLTSMKGLSLAYSKDMQEDKEPLFDTFDTLSLCLRAAAGMIKDMTINVEGMHKNAGAEYSTATDLADWLVKSLDIPFRNAHELTGQIVKSAEERGVPLWELPIKIMQNIEPRINDDVIGFLQPSSAIMSRNSFGGTSPDQVKMQISEARKRFL